MRKWQIVVVGSFLAAGCAAGGTVKPATERAEDPVESITVTWRSPWPGAYMEGKRPPVLFTKKLPVAVIFIPSGGFWHPDSPCEIDMQDFDSRVVRNLKNRGIEADSFNPAPLYLHVYVDMTDAPRGTSDVPEFCTMTIWTRLVAESTQRVAWAPETEFKADIEFFEHSAVIRLQPENARAEFEKTIDFQLDWIEHLLLGQEGKPE